MLHHDAEACGIPGLRLEKEFITEEEEQALLADLNRDEITWEGHTGRRRVAHFGVRFDNAVQRLLSMPQIWFWLADTECFEDRRHSAISTKCIADCSAH